MHTLEGVLVPLLIIIGVALILWYVNERFAPDPLLKKIIQVVLFIIVLIAVIVKLFPLISAGAAVVMSDDNFTFMVVGVKSGDGKTRMDEKFFLGRLPNEGEAVEMVYVGRVPETGDMRFQLRVKE